MIYQKTIQYFFFNLNFSRKESLGILKSIILPKISTNILNNRQSSKHSIFLISLPNTLLLYPPFLFYHSYLSFVQGSLKSIILPKISTNILNNRQNTKYSIFPIPSTLLFHNSYSSFVQGSLKSIILPKISINILNNRQSAKHSIFPIPSRYLPRYCSTILIQVSSRDP